MANELPFRADESRLELAEKGRPWTFDADGALFRLVSEAQRIRLRICSIRFADELEREKARQRTYDAMQRKAGAGDVCGGRTFGYRNVEVPGPDGKRSHVTRAIDPEEAAVVRRTFELSAQGAGLAQITKALKQDGAIAPRPQQGRPAGWAPSSVREVLLRPYRGEIVWNQTRKRDQWGQSHRSTRAAGDWLRVPAPHLEIVSDDLWTEAQARFAERRRQFSGRPREIESRYLLSGFARCGQ